MRKCWKKYVNDANAFIECSNAIDDVNENINDYNPRIKRKILVIFDDMIADIMINKMFQAITKELFIRRRKLNISPVFITQSITLFDYENKQQKKFTKHSD